MKKYIANKKDDSDDTDVSVSENLTAEELDDLTAMSKEQADEIIKSLVDGSENSCGNLYDLWNQNAHKAYGLTWENFCEVKLSPANILVDSD